MCYSANVSFAVAAALVPAGAHAIALARRSAPHWTLLATFPLGFAIQQAAEGLVWTWLDAGQMESAMAAARAYLFFSHFFWLFYVPLAAMAAEPEQGRRRLLGAIAAIGAAYGLLLFLPPLTDDASLSLSVVGHSIHYRTALPLGALEGGFPGDFTLAGDTGHVLAILYALIILAALFISSHRRLHVFGGMVMVSLVIAGTVFTHAFASIWCFFAAILSFYIVVVLALRAGKNERLARTGR